MRICFAAFADFKQIFFASLSNSQIPMFCFKNTFYTDATKKIHLHIMRCKKYVVFKKKTPLCFEKNQCIGSIDFIA
jgi:hypothetical protein